MSIIIPLPPGKRIGLLGGSFNPAHDGHLHITEQAIEHLELECVMWLISPQNPLKSENDMKPLAERLLHGEYVARHNSKIIVSDIESKLGTVYSAETLSQLIHRFPDVGFVWLMGADNLLQFDQWKDWQTIFNTLPIAIFARSPYSDGVMSCEAATHFADSRLDVSQSAELIDMKAPAWIYLETPLNPESATRIRIQN